MTAVGFYQSPRWRALRLQALQRDHWRCTKCGTSVARKGQSRVDHIQPRKTHPHLELALNNLRTLCTGCDNQRHREKGFSKAPARYDSAGNPVDPRHPWITGKRCLDD